MLIIQTRKRPRMNDEELYKLMLNFFKAIVFVIVFGALCKACTALDNYNGQFNAPSEVFENE